MSSQSSSCDGPATKWVFCLNHYTEEEFAKIRERLRDIVVYYIIGKEIGPINGTPHLQGFFVLRHLLSSTALESLLCKRASFQIAWASVENNFRYCSKQGDFVVFDIRPKDYGSELSAHSETNPPSRNKVAQDFKSLLDSKGREGLAEFAELYKSQYLFYGASMFKAWILNHTEIPRTDVHVEWVHGPSGSGKSKYAHEKYPKAYIKEPSVKWWDHYMFEKECIIDGLVPKQVALTHLLKWFDKYRIKVETKGGMLPCHVEKFIVTSHFHPRQCYKYEEPSLIESLMRLVEVKHMEK